MSNSIEELRATEANSQDLLYKAETVFPFILFPDTVTIDREKLTIVNRTFFRVAKINSIQISDIQSIEVDVGPFFGSIHISSKYFVNNPRSVKFLTRTDAVNIQRLVQGMIITTTKEIESSSVDKEKLVDVLTSLGDGRTD
jgi:hypothetical protein